MSKYIKLENDDFLPVYVRKEDVCKVEVGGIDEDAVAHEQETVYVYVDCEDDAYTLVGPIGLAESIMAELEQVTTTLSIDGMTQTVKS